MRSRRVRCRWRSGLRSQIITHRKKAYRRRGSRAREEKSKCCCKRVGPRRLAGVRSSGTQVGFFCAESDVTFLSWDRRKETMGNRPAGYWILVLIAIAAAVAAFMMRSSPDPHTRAMAQYLGWGAIALLLIGRFFFRGK